MRKVSTYREYTIYLDADTNYRVKPPGYGMMWSEPAANLKTAKKWIDAAVIEANNYKRATAVK